MMGKTIEKVGKLGLGFIAMWGFLGCESPQLQETDPAATRMAGKADHGNTSPEKSILTCSHSPTGHDPNGIHNMGKSPHFEGWYYRATDETSGESWVVIVAYWVDKEGDTQAFVEAVEATSGRVYKTVYSDLNLGDIQKDAGEFYFEVGNLIFTDARILGDFVADSGETVFLDWRIDNCALWGAPEDENNRWTMGWATEMPGVPLRWHVHHLKGSMTGFIQAGDHATEFHKAALHQEKNWGVAFPSSWVWFQVNVFPDRPDVAFAAAGGPIFPVSFSPKGYMAGLRWKDQFFNWRSQDTHGFPEVSFSIDSGTNRAKWKLTGENLGHRFEMTADAPLDELIPIDVPTATGLKVGAVEHLNARMTIKFYTRNFLGWTLVDTVESPFAAVEAGGEYARQFNLIP